MKRFMQRCIGRGEEVGETPGDRCRSVSTPSSLLHAGDVLVVLVGSPTRGGAVRRRGRRVALVTASASGAKAGVAPPARRRRWATLRRGRGWRLADAACQGGDCAGRGGRALLLKQAPHPPGTLRRGLPLAWRLLRALRCAGYCPAVRICRPAGVGRRAQAAAVRGECGGASGGLGGVSPPDCDAFKHGWLVDGCPVLRILYKSTGTEF